MTIHDFLSAPTVDLPALQYYLNRLAPAARVREVRSLQAAEQAKLFEAAAGGHPVRLTELVPEATPPMQEVVHLGRNSLPVLSLFQKRFCRPADREDELWGYNEHVLKPLIGPGYFVARQAGAYEVIIDYAKTPPDKPASWPKVLPNSARLGRFVYYGLSDILRGVSRHVTVGRAVREGKPVDNWFVLCRA